MDLEQYIRQFCNKNSTSISQLAKNANISRNTLYQMMDTTSPTLVNIAKLAHVMQVHPQFLIQLEWEKYNLNNCSVNPINPLEETQTWFNTLKDSSHFIAETIADGSLVRTGEVFLKTWRLQNTGTTTWKNRWLVCQDSEAGVSHHPRLEKFIDNRCFIMKPNKQKIAIPTTQAGETVDLSVEFTAPTVPASAFSYWKMTDNEGNLCFPESIGVYVQVNVISAGSANV